MSQSKQESNSANLGNAFSTAFSVGGQVACLNLVVIFLSLIIGIWLDRLLGTKPAFTLILVIGSIPLSLILTYFLAKREAKLLNKSQQMDKSLNREE